MNTPPPLGLHYDEDSDTRLAGTYAVRHAESVDVKKKTTDAQAGLVKKLQDKGWLDGQKKALVVMHLNDVPPPSRVVDTDTDAAFTMVWFDYHIRADHRCRCGPEMG